MQQNFECVGLTDVATTVENIVKVGGEIDFGTVGGTGSAYHEYSFDYIVDGETIKRNVKGRVELVQALSEAACEGDIIYSSLSALGGRNNYYWFVADMTEEKPDPEELVKALILEEGVVKEEAQEQEVDYDSLNASPAAIDLMKAHKIDPEKVTATGKGGKFVKGDVVKYLDSVK